MGKFIQQLNWFLRIKRIYLLNNEIILSIPVGVIKLSLFFLKKTEFCRFDLLTDMFCIDYLQQLNRFEISYSLLSVHYNLRIKVKIFLRELEEAFSVNAIYRNSSWFEREIWDLFGIFIRSSFDLRRILTDYGFIGFPLRKDFMLSGYFNVKYDFFEKSLLFEKIKLDQMRNQFIFLNPWE